MNDLTRRSRDVVVSLRLTVVLLSLGMVLIFWATLSQVELGIWSVQKRFFHTFLVLERIPGTRIWAPFPGGYAIGGVLLLNLISAHIYRFKLTGKKLGIQLTHTGLIVLLVGELLSGLWQESYTMRIREGQTVNYAEHERDYELALIDTTDANFEEVVAVPESLLVAGRTVQNPKLPFRVVPKLSYANATLAPRADQAATPASPATAGVGPRVLVTPRPLTYKENERNVPAIFVEFLGTAGSLGTWLISPDLDDAKSPQTFTLDGHTWKIVMRPARLYKPFSIALQEVRHDVYPGTDIPKNFSSRIHLTTPDGRDDRDVLIYMNNPMRHGGFTFYQYQMDVGHRTTVLQAVRNPSWVMPYVACTLMTLGLCVQFLIHLWGFIKKRRAAAPAAA